MSVKIVLNKPDDHVYTNMDLVTGVVHIDLAAHESITSVVAEFQGISRTDSVSVVEYDQMPKQSESEHHIVLNQSQTVFPHVDVQTQLPTKKNGFTLSSGHYEFLFQFEIPMHNECHAHVEKKTNPIVEAVARPFVNPIMAHIKTPLPPTLPPLPNNELAVEYFVKVTMRRSGWHRSNLAAKQAINIIPIEPLRPYSTIQQAYAKREHAFRDSISDTAKPQRRKSLFETIKEMENRSSPAAQANNVPPSLKPQFSVQSRLPYPPILTPNTPLPLRIIVKKLEPLTSSLVVRIVQIRLYCKTQYRINKRIFNHASAHDLYANPDMEEVLGSKEQNDVGMELEIDSSFWERILLPRTLVPSFVACNISRKYRLDVSVGLSLGISGQIEMVPLAMDVHIFSGITSPTTSGSPRLSRTFSSSSNPTSLHSPTHAEYKVDSEASDTEAPVYPTSIVHISKRPEYKYGDTSVLTRQISPISIPSSSEVGPPSDRHLHPRREADVDMPPGYHEASPAYVPRPPHEEQREEDLASPNYEQSTNDDRP